MTQHDFARIIASGQRVVLTPELMAMAQESAHRQRNEAIHSAFGVMLATLRLPNSREM